MKTKTGLNHEDLFPHYFHAEDGIRIFYKTNFQLNQYDSKKILLVFNYGLVCNFEHWKKQIPFFDKNGFQILIHDYRCHFNSSGEDDLASCHFKQIATDLNQLLESLKAKNIFLIGHSMGVNVTLEYASLFPKNLRGLVLISGTILPPQEIMFDSPIVDVIEPYIKLFADHYPNIYETVWKKSFLNPIMRKIIHRGGFNPTQVPDEFVHTYMKKIGELPSEIFFHLLNEMKNHDVVNILNIIETPSLVIGGDKDKVIPNYLQTILAEQLPKGELYIVREGSHVPHVDFPESINDRILLFIEKN